MRLLLTRTPAQVEGLLKTVHRPAASHFVRADGASTEGSSPSTFGSEPSRPEQPQGHPRGPAVPWKPLSPYDSPSSRDSAQPGELLGLGQFESLPPFEMIEDLYVPIWRLVSYTHYEADDEIP